MPLATLTFLILFAGLITLRVTGDFIAQQLAGCSLRKFDIKGTSVVNNDGMPISFWYSDSIATLPKQIQRYWILRLILHGVFTGVCTIVLVFIDLGSQRPMGIATTVALAVVLLYQLLPIKSTYLGKYQVAKSNPESLTVALALFLLMMDWAPTVRPRNYPLDLIKYLKRAEHASHLSVIASSLLHSWACDTSDELTKRIAIAEMQRCYASMNDRPNAVRKRKFLAGSLAFASCEANQFDEARRMLTENAVDPDTADGFAQLAFAMIAVHDGDFSRAKEHLDKMWEKIGMDSDELAEMTIEAARRVLPDYVQPSIHSAV